MESGPAQLENAIDALTMARSLVNRHVRVREDFGVDTDDLVGAALVGYCRARNTFDSAAGVDFRTYARMRMQWAIRDFARAEARQLGASTSLRSAGRAYSKALLLDTLRSLGVALVWAEDGSPHATYLDSPRVDDAVMIRCDLQKVRELVKQLSPADQELLKAHYFDDVPLANLARLKFGRSRSWTVRRHRQVLDGLQKALEGVGK